MDWNHVEGDGNEGQGEGVEGHVDLDVIDGRQDELEGRLRQRYARDQAKDIDDWCGRQKWQERHSCASLKVALNDGGPRRRRQWSRRFGDDFNKC